MMRPHTVCYIILLLLIINKTNGISSRLQPYAMYQYSTELELNRADLWCTINESEQEITFELHIKTRGWIGLGIRPGT
ncbi:unnamed protein product [Rotaria sp. Silwood1]|nr:unnamed protein product [Rotaria sp. Silwood1]